MLSSDKGVQICVVGGGVCGLTSIKCCLDAGLKVTCFERSPHYGGLWHYQDDSAKPADEFIASVMKTTILNTSKELTAFSDFPMPAHLPNFMKHDLYMDYIRSYVQHFNLEYHLRLMHEIVRIAPAIEEQTNLFKWSVDVLDKSDHSNPRMFNCKFDKLILAIGHHNVPYLPQFSGQQKFGGLIVHSATLKNIITDQRLVDKRVVVVGIGNSALDAANDLALVASKCYLSCHRGSWIRSRLTPVGPHDFRDRRRFNYYKTKYLPNNLIDSQRTNELKLRTNHEMLGLKPKHRVTEMAPATNDIFPYRVFTGGVCLKGSLTRFTEHGVVFEGEEDREYHVDVVVLATGYTYQVPFLDEVQLGLSSQKGGFGRQLYLNVFAPSITLPPELEKRVSHETVIKSLAYIGFAQPSGSIAIIGELQARFVAQVFTGRQDLPSFDKMMRWIDKLEKVRAHLIKSQTRDQVVGTWIGYCDLIADKLGVKPNMFTLFFRDFPLWKRLMFGPSVAYQYRLRGHDSWNKAREAIMTVNKRVYAGINEGKNDILMKARRKRLDEQHVTEDGRTCFTKK